MRHISIMTHFILDVRETGREVDREDDENNVTLQIAQWSESTPLPIPRRDTLPFMSTQSYSQLVRTGEDSDIDSILIAFSFLHLTHIYFQYTFRFVSRSFISGSLFSTSQSHLYQK